MTSSPDRRVLVTGATGFIGTALCIRLLALGYTVRRALRNSTLQLPNDSLIGNMGSETKWGDMLNDIDLVVHLAARTHVLRETALDTLAEYQRINITATENLARACTKAKIKRLVFLSSIKVNGESTSTCTPFSETDTPAPEDAYGISKWKAEQALHTVSAENGLNVVVLRTPLVYGPGVKGNFLRLMNTVARGLPLPLRSIHNQRSLIYTENLIEAIVCCIESPSAINKTFLVSDGEDVSTPALILRLATALGVRARLFPCPPALLGCCATLIGKSNVWHRISQSLRVDNSRIRSELGWQPMHSVHQGLENTARWYLSKYGK